MLSIVIPTLNEEKYLAKLLNSIKSQNFQNYEIIISDGDSEDKTVEIAKNFSCRVIIDKKRSPARQRNNGAKIAKGAIILFLDADTKMPDDFLERTYKEFNDRKLGLAGFYLIFNSSKVRYRILEAGYALLCYLGQFTFPSSVGVGIMVKKKFHKKIKGFDESIFIGEDYDYIKKISKLCKYRMIRSVKLYFSVRRLEKEGTFKVLWKWFKGGFYFVTKGPIKKKIVDYEFGKY